MRYEMMACKDRHKLVPDPADTRHHADFHWAFRADPQEVRGTLRRAVDYFSDQITPDEAGRLELVLAEVLNNVVEHGYAGLAAGPIAVNIARDPEALWCQITDQGGPMPGVTLPDGRMQPVAECVADLAEGGWGWALIHELTCDLTYRRSAHTNSVSFRVPVLGRQD